MMAIRGMLHHCITPQSGPLLACGDRRCAHGLTGHDERGRCEWVACKCGGYSAPWREAEA